MPEKNNGISIPPDFLKWRPKENGVARTRLLEDVVYCITQDSGDVILTITRADGVSARIDLSPDAARCLANLLSPAPYPSLSGAPEAAGD